MSWATRAYAAVIRLWPLTQPAFRLAGRPLAGALVRPLFSPRANQATIVPVNEVLRAGRQVALPRAVLAPLVQRAGARVIMHDCICRRSAGCTSFPRELGCLFLGEGAARIDPALGRQVSAAEALAHVEAAVQRALVPLIVHTRFDAYVLRIPYRRMLTVCFCCDCCCAIRAGMRLAPAAFGEIVQRLPGLQVQAGDDCTGCGICLESCPTGAITLRDGRALISGACSGCGRCAEQCPTGNIRLSLDETGEVFADLLARIEQHTDFGPAGPRAAA